MENNHNKISTECYNALVHNYALVEAALDKCSVEVPFYDDAKFFLFDLSAQRARKYGFDFDRFWYDVKSCKFYPGLIYHPKSAVQSNDKDSFQSILNELIRAFKNRAPGLGERFERVVEQNERVARATVAYLITEYLYLDRSASYLERERRNETFRLAMFESHNEALYIAAYNTIRSFAASMARAKLALDVKTAIGDENNAD